MIIIYQQDTYTVDLVLEKLREAKNEIDPVKLATYGRLYPITIQRRLGFLLDVAGISSGELYKSLKKRSGFARLTKNSNMFSA
ncbi:hypothetical protein HKBW3S09_01771, partial [Candidatus Hakubella thermalkaliphila]